MSTTNTPTALIVEDDENDLLFLKRAMRDEFVFCEAGTLAEALIILQQTKPALILLDLALPDSKHPDTLAAIMKVRGEAAVVIVSGRGDDEFMRACIKCGAHGFLFKNRLPHINVVAEVKRFMEAKVKTCCSPMS